jgi:catechol 2,3-dioxygenase-like lactoylglutathione lyase family enzyme
VSRELRLILTVADVDAALALFRDSLGLEQLEAWETESSRGYLLAAGRATLELADEGHAAAIDELEVGHRVAGPVRLAFAVDDSDAAATRLEGAGAVRLAGPVETPWGDVNVRVQVPGGVQLTLFS